jgi:hypothetical protein
MNSPFRFAAPITARCTAPVTSRPGGRLPASTPSRWPASFGNAPGCTSRALRPRHRRKMPLRSALQRLTAKAKVDQRQLSDGWATANMLTAIGLCVEGIFNSALQVLKPYLCCSSPCSPQALQGTPSNRRRTARHRPGYQAAPDGCCTRSTLERMGYICSQPTNSAPIHGRSLCTVWPL